MRNTSSREALLLALCMGCSGLLLLASCSEDENTGRKEDPLQLREVIPADSTLFPKDELIPTLSLRFNRPAEISEVTINIYPEPAQRSELMRSSTGHTLFFEALKFSTLMDNHFLWLDGPTMPSPRKIVWMDGQGDVASIIGSLLTNNPNPVRNASALVYLLPLDTGFAPSSDPESFADARPLAIAQPIWNGLTGEFDYNFGGLPDNMAFYAVAIVDINDDGFYDPGADTWGAYGANPGFLFLETVVSAVAAPMGPPLQAYDFVLQPPLSP